MLEDLDGIAVVAVQAVFGAEPHESPGILKDGPHDILRKAFVDGDLIETKMAGLRERGGNHNERNGRRHQKDPAAGEYRIHNFFRKMVGESIYLLRD